MESLSQKNKHAAGLPFHKMLFSLAFLLWSGLGAVLIEALRQTVRIE